TVDVSTTAAAAAVLHLADTTITSGTVSDRGALFLDGADLIQSGSLGTSAPGQGQVTAGSNTLHNETVSNAGAIEVLAGATLTIDGTSTVANAGGSITVDVSTTAAAAAVLHLADTTITSGTVSDRGALFLDGADLIQSGSL